MSRSLKKGPYVDQRLLKKVINKKPGDLDAIKTWSRNCSITPEMVGFVFGVHNGRQHTSVPIIENMVGHKLGEFSPTRKFVKHGGKKQREAEAAAAVKAAPAAATPDKKK